MPGGKEIGESIGAASWSFQSISHPDKENKMKSKWTVGALIILGLIASASFVARAEDKDKDEENEKKTSLDKIPAAAKDALVKEVGDEKKIDKVVEGTRDGKTYYEAQWKDGDKKMEVQVDADGKVVKAKHEEKDEGDKDKDKDEKK
jgi:hypothetical protein